MHLTKYKNPERQKLSEKILLQLADSVDFGCTYRFEKEFGFSGKIFRNMIGANKNNLKDSIAELRRSKFIEKKEGYKGSVIISLTEKGMLRALGLRFKALHDKKENWDGNWRMVAFDIPEEYRKGRNALRYRVRMAGFFELQKSLFLFPYDCEKEIKDLIKLFKLEKYVRFALVGFIDNQEKLKTVFGLE